MTQKAYDYIIIGAGIYGLYAAKKILANRPQARVVVLEHDAKPFQRSSFINQARVHNGYHYPRSFATAIKSIHYFNRFAVDFSFAINNTFKQIYAVSERHSLTNGEQFAKFCARAGVPCTPIEVSEYFKSSLVESAFETLEYSFDADKIRDFLLSSITGQADIVYNFRLERAVKNESDWQVYDTAGNVFAAPFVLNATYASVNQVIEKFGYGLFSLKYEIAEVITCTVSDVAKHVGLTVMDGPFFSLMPFGLSGQHTLTSVMFTPHRTSSQNLPTFVCQNFNPNCSPAQLDNCNHCPARPQTAWKHMEQMAKTYLIPEIELTYRSSLFAIKPILNAAEADDSRPTVVKVFSESPTFMSVLSGKINTIYDLDPFLA